MPRSNPGAGGNSASCSRTLTRGIHLLPMRNGNLEEGECEKAEEQHLQSSQCLVKVGNIPRRATGGALHCHPA